MTKTWRSNGPRRLRREKISECKQPSRPTFSFVLHSGSSLPLAPQHHRYHRSTSHRPGDLQDISCTGDTQNISTSQLTSEIMASKRHRHHQLHQLLWYGRYIGGVHMFP